MSSAPTAATTTAPTAVATGPPVSVEQGIEICTRSIKYMANFTGKLSCVSTVVDFLASVVDDRIKELDETKERLLVVKDDQVWTEFELTIQNSTALLTSLQQLQAKLRERLPYAKPTEVPVESAIKKKPRRRVARSCRGARSPPGSPEF